MDNRQELYRKKVNVTIQNDITTYKNYCLPLSMIQANPNKSNWILEHFINIYMIKNKKGVIWLDFLENVNFHEDVLEVDTYNAEMMLTEQDVLNRIIENIRNDSCVMLFVDNHYLNNSNTVINYHYPVQCFLFGFDRCKKIFWGLEFRHGGGYAVSMYKFKDIEDGYKSCINRLNANTFSGRSKFKNFTTRLKKYINISFSPIWVNWYNYMSLKIKVPYEEYRFNPKVVIDSLEKYIHSSQQLEELRPEIVHERGELAIFGYEAQKQLIASFNKLIEGEFVFDYRSIHLLAEHKKLMYKRLINMCHVDHEQSDDIRLLVNEYVLVTNAFEKNRCIFLKNVLVDNNMKSIYGLLKNKHIIQDILESLQVAADLEKKIILRLIPKLKNYYNI